MKKYISLYNILLGLIALLVGLAILAPILMHFGIYQPAKYIYLLYSFFCHQIGYRSLHILGYQYAWCARDTFIWLGLLSTGIAGKFFRTRSLKWYEAVLFVVPIALDGGIQLIATVLGYADNGEVLYVSTNFSRMVTGSIFGIGLGLWIFPTLNSLDFPVKKYKEFDIKKLAAIIFVSLFVVYLGLVAIWSATATDFKPIGVLDAHSRLPENREDWFDRRTDGACPVDNTDTINFTSFDCK